MLRTIIICTALLFFSGSMHVLGRLAVEEKLLYLSFNEGEGLTVHNDVNHDAMCVSPSCDWIQGITGTALLFNGFTTRIIIPSGKAPKLNDAFTVDLYFAPASYPKSSCPIIYNHRGSHPFSIEIDVHGMVAFTIGNQRLISRNPLPLTAWNRITCCFDSQHQAHLAVNHQEDYVTEHLREPVKADSAEIWIGRTPARVACPYENKEIPIFCSLDGALDEMTISNGTALYDHVVRQKRVSHEPPPFEQRRLPSGPDKPLAFGSWYIPLKYYKQWDEQWRSETPDVVVGFGESLPYRVVFWKGISYAPCFVTEKGNWMSNEFIERKKVTNWGCCENMSDKHADFSSVRILENTPARTVVHWRNAPVGVNQKFPYEDPETGWGDWSEETYYFYPDGTGVRKMVVWSSRLDEWYEWCQSLQVLHPGQRPEDILDSTRIMSVANMDGQSQVFGWEYNSKPTQHLPSIPQANIQVTYMNSTWNPFLILDDRAGENERGHQGPEITRYAGKWSDYSGFPWRNHWPVTQDLVIGRYAVSADGPAHTYTATQYNAPYAVEEGKMTKLMLCGCTDQDAGQLLPLAKSWLRAPRLTVLSGPCQGGQYDQTQRAYTLCCNSDSTGDIRLLIDASADSPLQGICLIFTNWTKEEPTIRINGLPTSPGSVRIGHLSQYDGNRLLLWLNLHATTPQTITLH